MLFLDDNLPEINEAKVAHFNAVSCRIKKKIYGLSCSSPVCLICKRTRKASSLSRSTQQLANLLSRNGNLTLILISKPNDLFRLSEMLWRDLVPGFSWAGYDQFLSINRKPSRSRTLAEIDFHSSYNDAIKAFKDVFEYDTWFNGDNNLRYDAYTLAAKLNRNTCTYCNRMYTHTVERVNGSKVMRPQFDHWFSKSRHPALSMSFYNLIPSCSICNTSVKGSLDFTLETHLHPYIDKDCHDKFFFTYSFHRTSQKCIVKIISSNTGESKIAQTFNDLKLETIFNTHYAELNDLIKIKKAYSTKYIDKLIKAFPDIHLSQKEIYRLAFGAEFDGSDFHKRPLSKFKKDILLQLKLIK